MQNITHTFKLKSQMVKIKDAKFGYFLCGFFFLFSFLFVLNKKKRLYFQTISFMILFTSASDPGAQYN